MVHKWFTRFLNSLSVVLLVIGGFLSYFIPTNIDKIETRSRKESYIESSKNIRDFIKDQFSFSTTPTILTRVMETFDVSLEQFLSFAEGSTSRHDIGSTLYVVKIGPSDIPDFEESASKIHGRDIKIVNEMFQEISNSTYTEDVLWPVLYEYFPDGSDGQGVDFTGFNVYWGKLQDVLDEMVESELLVYSDPILFISSNTIGLLLIRPILSKNNEIKSCIVRGLRPSNFLSDVDADFLKEEFGSYISLYIERDSPMLLFSSNPRIDTKISLREDNCEKEQISSRSFMLVCISNLVDKKKDTAYILSVCGGILASILIAVLVKVLQVVSDTEKRSRIKSKIIAHFSHELRTPMNVIVGMSELLSMESELPKKCISQVSSIKTSVGILLSIIEDVLNISNMESNKMKVNISSINIRKVIHDAVETAWNSTMSSYTLDETTIEDNNDKSKVKLTLSMMSSVPCFKVMADHSKIVQIVTNLVSNSIKFTKEGTIDVVTETKSLGDSKLVLEIRVSDTGVGMSKECMETMFEPFSGFKMGKPGAGLGLSICKNLTDIMGGDLRYTSVVGKGTTFIFSCILTYTSDIVTGTTETFVFYEHGKKHYHKRTFKIQSSSEVKPLVLVVDDISINRLVLSNILEKMGVDVKTCNDGAQCVEMCKHIKFSVILMDVFMPVLDGIDATDIIRRMCPKNRKTPILFVSAAAEDSYIERCLKAGGNAFLRKPVKMEILYEELQKNII